MPLPNDLDPKEVLAHLKVLGYHNITKQQLTVFMHDLKKLIRYDQMKEQTKTIRHDQLREQKENQVPFQTQIIGCDQFKENQEPFHTKLIQHDQTRNKKQTHAAKQSSKTHLSHHPVPMAPINQNISPRRRLYSESTVSSRQKSKELNDATLKTECYLPKRVLSSQHTKPNINHKVGTTSDPVALYQYYKQVWDAHPLPGQDNRAELRRKVRQKLMANQFTAR